MPVPTTIADLSTTAGSNYPAGTDSPSTLDDVQRAHASFIAQLRDGANINTATGKTTPVDADELPLADSAASFVLKKLTWANLKATLLTWLQGTVFPSPGAIGGTTPAAGSFTTLESTGDYSSSQNQSIYSYNGGVIGSVRAGVQLVGSIQQVRAYTAGTLRSVIDSTGAASFGDLPSPSTWSVGKTIEVGYAGNGLFANGASSMSVIANAYYNAGWKYASADYATIFQCVSGVYSWQITPTAGAAPGDAATMTTKMSLDNTGLAVTGALSATGVSFSGSAPANSMTLDASGNLLVGTTSSGASNTNSFVIAPSSGAFAGQHASGTASGTIYANFNYNAATIGSITQNGTTAVAYNTTSDHRLKTNVRPANAARFGDIQFVDFEWVDGRHDCGVIADQLQSVYPDLVLGEKDATEVRTVEITPAVPAVTEQRLVSAAVPAVMDGDQIVTPGVEAVYETVEVTPAIPAATEDQTFPVYQQVNYMGLIGRMGTVIQQQSKLIAAMEARLTALEAK